MLSVKVVNLGDLPAERRQSISETTDSCVSRTKLWRKLWSALGFLLTLPDVLSTNWELISGRGLLSLHLCALSHVLYRSSITLTSRGVCGLFQLTLDRPQHPGSKMMFRHHLRLQNVLYYLGFPLQLLHHPLLHLHLSRWRNPPVDLCWDSGYVRYFGRAPPVTSNNHQLCQSLIIIKESYVMCQ